ncbi:MAG: aminodeoxychorismate/anthranilate synthase component II [Candidatus Marinimicrobia bacterium]|nr:aminodeoxychorismate/anthranilate synthase component II [Candidatus Neomarinimicrobiota bacterium]
MITVIDNYDSFTYNLVQHLGELGSEISVFTNDEIEAAELLRMKPDALLISPGPGRPKDSGVSMEAIKLLGPTVPTLGICLGHQCIAELFGGKIIEANEILHGKTSLINHEKHPIFTNISNPFKATRYHSLVVEPDSMPQELESIATSDDGTIMALAHREYPIYGMQFHPESVFTNVGMHLLQNFLDIVEKHKSSHK